MSVRYDQQHGEILGDLYEAMLAGELKEMTFDAVAEYIAANDEWDAAWSDKSAPNFARRIAAEIRRSDAHARMKGETK